MSATDQTSRNYGEWQRAYDYFAELFDRPLPGCVITFQRHNHAYGFHAGSQFEATDTGLKADEIALNPSHFSERTPGEVLSTLVHEMAHQYQWHFGKPSPGGYHNKAWARLMIDIGLVPTDSGEPGGKATGRRVSHFIRSDGPFDRLCNKFLGEGFVIPYFEATLFSVDEAALGIEPLEAEKLAAMLKRRADELRKKKAASKSKYSCPGCDFPKHVWGKPGLHIICGECEESFEAATTDEAWPPDDMINRALQAQTEARLGMTDL